MEPNRCSCAQSEHVLSCSTIILTDLSQTERRELYRHSFQDETVPLQELAPPKEIKMHPARFSAEIQAAYLKHATVTIDTRINYDAGRCHFVFDKQRLQNSGHPLFSQRGHRLFLGETELKAFEERGTTMVYNLRFILKTYWFQPAQVTVEARAAVPTKKRKRTPALPEIDTFIACKQDHAELREWLEGVCEEIKEADTTAGKAGFVLADIYALAKRFKRLPTEEQQALRVGEGGFHDGPFERFRKDY